MLKWTFRIFGLGTFIAGLAPYLNGAKWPFMCNTVICTIGTTLITPSRALLGIGIFLMFISLFFSKRITSRR